VWKIFALDGSQHQTLAAISGQVTASRFLKTVFACRPAGMFGLSRGGTAPGQKTPFPDLDIAFPDLENGFPGWDCGIPYKEKGNPAWDGDVPGWEIAFPNKEIGFPGWDCHVPDKEKGIPG
jgi:hypothetical protein